MEINLRVNTDLPKDLVDLGKIAAAFSGSTAPAAQSNSAVKAEKPAAQPVEKATVKAEEKQEANTGADLAAASAPAARVTIEQVRTACSTKNTSDCKAVWTKMGFDGLSKIPTEKLAEALELVKQLKDK